jgi:hypothetical protein
MEIVMEILTGESIEIQRQMTLRQALKLETLGMSRSRSPSAYALVKKEFGFKGSKRRVLEQLTAHLNDTYGLTFKS